MDDNSGIEFIPPKKIDPNEAALQGGSSVRGTPALDPKGTPSKPVTGKQAQEEWEKTHGDIEEPTLTRGKKKKQTGEV